MAEVTNLPRLMAAAKEFNIGSQTLVDFLVSKNFSADDLKPNSRLTEEMYRVLQQEFQQDKAAKQKAEQIDLPKGLGEVKKKKDEEDLSFKKKEEKAKAVTPTPPTQPPVEETPVVEVEAKKEEPKQAEKKDVVEVTKIEAPEIEKPKVITKIDLDALDTGKRAKKSAKTLPEENKPEKKTSRKKSEVTPPAEEVTKPIEDVKPEEQAKDEPPVITKISAEKLTGPKVIGKIELPSAGETRPKREEEKGKRKRIPIKRPGTHPGHDSHGGHRGGKSKMDPRTAAGGPKKKETVIDEKEIQDKLKQTQAKLAGIGGRGKSSRSKRRRDKREELAEVEKQDGLGNVLQVTEFVTVSELAGLMDVSFTDIISKCMSLGVMVSINQRLEADIIELVADEYNYKVEFIGVEDASHGEGEEEDDDPNDVKPRAPIVTIMGHVDHGKTSLLDYIRNANVSSGEAGGITQHIGAYEVTTAGGRKITFLDTPGHEAFTAMRARGAKLTDIAVIVVAADDAVMPQTREAISHAQAASVPMIFAINKMDKENANPEKIKEQLAGMNILVESWGGKYQSQEISAKKGINVDQLLEKILLEADLLELKANPNRLANGTVVEASLDKGRGYVATVLVQNGTLKTGDMIVSGQYFGKVKAMYNERNQRIDAVPPSSPTLILGLNGAPQAGETFKVFENESSARAVATQRGQILREQGIRSRKHITLDEISRRLALGNFKELNVIIKGDVDGSVEALSDSLQKLSTEEIVVNVIHKAVGAITESDVTLANASDAIIIGFNVRPSVHAAKLAEQESIEIKTYSIIYNAIEEIRSAMEGMLEPSVEDKIIGNVEIRETYRFDKATVAGCFVLDGKITRNSRVRLIRDGIVIYTGELASLKRFKDDAKEVSSNMECGLVIKNYNDIKVGDIVEAFEEIEVKRTL